MQECKNARMHSCILASSVHSFSGSMFRSVDLSARAFAARAVLRFVRQRLGPAMPAKIEKANLDSLAPTPEEIEAAKK
eukprot:465067-Pyramimonas_sp.AAC.1